MNPKIAITTCIVLLGLLFGPSALNSALAAQPPLRWADIPTVFLGSAFGIVFVLWLQVLVRKHRAVKRFWWAFGVAGLGATSCGAYALVISLYRRSLDPPSLFILAGAIGVLFGLTVARRLFRSSFAA